jgi:hypothetical protein
MIPGFEKVCPGSKWAEGKRAVRRTLSTALTTHLQLYIVGDVGSTSNKYVALAIDNITVSPCSSPN